MTKQEKIEKVVTAIVNDFKEEMELDSYYDDIESWKEMVDMWDMTSKDIKEECYYILIKKNQFDFLYDDLSFEGDSTYDDVYYKDYMKLVRKEMNRWFKERCGK